MPYHVATCRRAFGALSSLTPSRIVPALAVFTLSAGLGNQFRYRLERGDSEREPKPPLSLHSALPRASRLLVVPVGRRPPISVAADGRLATVVVAVGPFFAARAWPIESTCGIASVAQRAAISRPDAHRRGSRFCQLRRRRIDPDYKSREVSCADIGSLDRNRQEPDVNKW